MGYNPELEKKYYSSLPKGNRIGTLIEQQTTVVAEAKLSTFKRSYRWQDFLVVDEVSGEEVGDLVARGGNQSETIAWQGIEGALVREDVTVVNFSPRNENLNYPQSVIDLWRRNGDEVIWTRVTVKDDFKTFSDVYHEQTGVAMSDKLEMLAKPIVIEGDVWTKVLDKFSIVKDKAKYGINEIRKVVEHIVYDFVNKFGEDFVLESNKLFRTFSGAMMEVESWSSRIYDFVSEKVTIAWQRLEDYAYRPMIVTVQPTYGCDKQNYVGGFAERFSGFLGKVIGRVQEIFGVKTFDCPRCQGKIESGKGIEKCPHCGLTKQEAGSVCD